MAKKGAFYRLDEDTIGMIDEIALTKKVSKSDALQYIVEEYYTELHSNKLASLEAILLMELKKMQEDLSRIRGTANVIDRHAQMQTEFWNHYFTGHPSKEFVTTEKYQRKELQEAEMLVKKRVAENRQKKVDYEKRKGQKES